MDFSQRGERPTQPAAAPARSSASGSASGAPNGKGKSKSKGVQLLKYASVFLVAAIAILLIAVTILSVTSKPESEEKYLDTKKMQAVFLNGGQVYFGNITSVNSKTLAMNNIYYLRVNQQVQPNSTTASNDVSLVKLGCELHGPEDAMVVNREQVVFWENLKDDGQVAKAVKQYKEQNPNGQKCEDTSTQGSNTPATNNTTNNTTKKP